MTDNPQLELLRQKMIECMDSAQEACMVYHDYCDSKSRAAMEGYSGPPDTEIASAHEDKEKKKKAYEQAKQEFEAEKGSPATDADLITAADRAQMVSEMMSHASRSE